jgi:hypothetical protein
MNFHEENPRAKPNFTLQQFFKKHFTHIKAFVVSFFGIHFSYFKSVHRSFACGHAKHFSGKNINFAKKKKNISMAICMNGVSRQN